MTTSVRPELLEYVRALVRGDTETYDRLQAQLENEGWPGFPRFLAALFFIAVDRRFGTNVDLPQIIRFVAEMRADVSDGGPPIDPVGAENLIRSIIDPTVDYDLDPDAIGTIQATAIYKILSEDCVDEELESVLAEASVLASRGV